MKYILDTPLHRNWMILSTALRLNRKGFFLEKHTMTVTNFNRGSLVNDTGESRFSSGRSMS
ncbi:MAG: hypothetical protein DU480_06750 [Nitrosomonas sp.]